MPHGNSNMTLVTKSLHWIHETGKQPIEFQLYHACVPCLGGSRPLSEARRIFVHPMPGPLKYVTMACFFLKVLGHCFAYNPLGVQAVKSCI